jgi:6-pyruvoyltetrahydropterin/6-carboxytetrahydropterin synthase
MNVRLVREFRFEAAHRLNNVPEGHRCGKLHGHSYRLEISLEGPVDPKSGWLIDFGEVDAVWRPVYDKLDHSLLNELPGLENTTCELLTKWIWDELKPSLPCLKKVTVWETGDARCEYEGY